MRRFRRWRLPILTVLLMAAGAAMPWAVFRVQDAYGENRQEERRLDAFSLTLREEKDLSQILRLVQLGNYYMSDWAQSSVLTEEEALAAVQDALALMADFGLVEPWVPENMSHFRAVLGSVFSEEEDISLAMWSIDSQNVLDGGNFFFWLDDASGKLFLISLPVAASVRGEDLYALMERWRQFLETYYGVEIQAVEENWYDIYVQFFLPFQLGEQGEWFQMELSLYFADGFTTLTPFVPYSSQSTLQP